MALLRYRHSQVVGLCAALPANAVDNWSESDVQRQSFVAHTGIRHRRVALPNDAIEDYFFRLAQQLLKGKELEPSQVVALVLVTQTPSLPIPSVACQLQGRLGLPQSCYAVDVNMGCSGFVYGMQIAASVLEASSPGQFALVLSGDFSSRIVDPLDAATSMIFSDGVAGALLAYHDHCPSSYNLETVGDGAQAIYSERVGADVFMRLNGIDVFAQSLGHVPGHLRQLWDFASLGEASQVPHYLHQANNVINQALKRELKLSHVPSSIEQYGNTSSASIPITMMHEPCMGEVVLCGFGVGFSIASVHLPLPDDLRVDWL